MLKFDERTQAILDNAYAGDDITRRRMANFKALDPQPGDQVLDLGCGQGLLTLALARSVGPSGHVMGVDPSPEMLKTARVTTAGFSNVSVFEGAADAIPCADGSIDRAVSVQVFEYVPDVPAALSEMRRVLRRNGRLAIGDFHWGTIAFHSEDPDRMRAVLTAFDEHLADPALPARLPALLRTAGFADVLCNPLTFVDTTLRPDGVAAMYLVLIEAFVRGRRLLPDADITAWAAEQHELAAGGRFFFALTHVVTSARRD